MQKCDVIPAANQKGGVGKKVLLPDFDHQSALSFL